MRVSFALPKCVLLAHLLAAPLAAEDVVLILPSGQDVTLLELRAEPDAGLLRLRYLAPALGSPMTRPSFENLTADLEYLCTFEGLPAIAKGQYTASQIVVSLSAEPVTFGTLSPDVAQVFEAFLVENDTCILEVF